MTEEKNVCLPSQVTINIGASGVKINDDGKPPAPPVDLSKYVTKEAADKSYAPLAQVAGIADSVRSAKTDAADAKKTAASAKSTADDALAKATEKGISKADADAAYAPRALVEYAAEEARKAAAVAAEAKSKVLVIDPGFPVPAGTPRGALVVRPNRIMEVDHQHFAPISAWPRFAGVTLENDGLHVPGAIGFQPSLEQMLPSVGIWQITISYTWKPNFDEKEEAIPVYNVRTWDEFGNGEIKQDEGAKIGEIALKAGEHQTSTLRVKPAELDPKATGLWAPRVQAPAAGFVVHGMSVDYISQQE